MQRFKRSAAAPRGPAFFLFLGLAIVPISLRVAGIQVSFSPSLSAAADAWQQIADAFGSGYQPARAFDSSSAPDQAREPLRAFDSSACQSREFAWNREVNELSATAEGVAIPDPQARATRPGCPRASTRASVAPAAVEQIIVETAGTEAIQKHVRAFRMLSTLKLEAFTHCGLRGNDALLKNVERQIIERSVAIPRSMLMPVPVKTRAIPSATKAAECKVRAALDSARRIERERAMLTSFSFASPDNCEL